jgi:hypothetical protein
MATRRWYNRKSTLDVGAQAFRQGYKDNLTTTEATRRNRFDA